MKIFKFDFEMTCNKVKSVTTEYIFADDEPNAQDLARRLLSVWGRLAPNIAQYGAVVSIQEASDVPFNAYIFGGNQNGKWYSQWLEEQKNARF